ncbi:DNA cytosine methyltransferase [Streptomyces canus]|uniref:DNA cytosine methyltransferase n=1 Tax=Streptomyces canus TaxID=58343 RepID=UPI002E35E1F6|nr:DUF6339 family protein [Streptomyces canus]
MAYLFPRLLPAAAAELADTARRSTLEELRLRADYSHPALFYAATGGMRVPQTRLREIREAILGVATDHGFPHTPLGRSVSGFDVPVAEILHRDAGIIPAEAVVGDLWAFLSLIVMPDVAAWRFPKLHPERVQGVDVTRHVFGRLWWRAHLVHDHDAPREDLYALLAVLSESAFDQIYGRRVSLGASPHLVRSIIRVWEAADIPTTEVSERNLLRDFLMRLIRLRAFVSFESLEAEDLDDELRAALAESLHTLTRAADAEADDEVPPDSPAPTTAGPDSEAIPVGPTTGEHDRAGENAEHREAIAALGGPRVRQAPTAVDVCAGVGGQALGLEQAGFTIQATVDIDADSCVTLHHNRPDWHVIHEDIRRVDTTEHSRLNAVDLLCCGLPRSPYTMAGLQQAMSDPRDALEAALEMALVVRPRVLLLENIPTFQTDARFGEPRKRIQHAAQALGYELAWGSLQATDFETPQNRVHGFVVAMAPRDMRRFSWPTPTGRPAPSLGQTLLKSMAARGWPQAAQWAARAEAPAPLIVGGATGRGGADLGPSRAKAQWARVGVYGGSIGDDVPGPDFRLDLDAEPRHGLPRLTVEQVALLQGLPDEWTIRGKKTSAYRQVSQAVPPRLARELGQRIIAALD